MLCLALVAGCSGRTEPAVDREEAAALARAHREDLERFERWALRIASSDTHYGSREELEEVAFAPVRGNVRIAGAWIERRGPDPWTIAEPAGALVPELAWRRTRAEGGDVEVADDGTRDWLRRSSAAPDGATLLVTLAFLRAPP